MGDKRGDRCYMNWLFPQRDRFSISSPTTTCNYTTSTRKNSPHHPSQTTIMHISPLHLGALLSLAQSLRAARVHIENIHPPANKYVTHCTVQIDGDVFGCQDASSNGFKHGCGDNKVEGTQQICNSAAVTVNWDTLLVTFNNNAGDTASCTLNKNFRGGECEMDP